MRSTTLARLVWILAAATALYALLNVVLYFTTGTFGTTWFVLSLVVYGAVALTAGALAFAESRKEAEAPAAPPEEPSVVLTPSAPGRSVQAEVDVKASPERAVLAFLDVDTMRTWWQAERGRVDARAGGVWMLAWGGDGATFEQALTGIVEAFDPWKRLALANVVRLDARQHAVGPTRLEIEVEERGSLTRVRLRESGFGEGAAWDAAYEAAVVAWPELLQDLKKHLEEAAQPAGATPAPRARPATGT